MPTFLYIINLVVWIICRIFVSNKTIRIMTTEKIIGIIKNHIGYCGEGANEMYELGYETAISNIIRDVNGAIQRELDGETQSK